MTQPKYLLRNQLSKRVPIVQTELLHVSHPELKRVVEKIGPFDRVEGTGVFDKATLSLSTPDLDMYTRGHCKVAATATGVRKGVRRLRDQEAQLLDVIDGELEVLAARTAKLKTERNQLLLLAWKCGNTVTLKDMLECVRAK